VLCVYFMAVIADGVTIIAVSYPVITTEMLLLRHHCLSMFLMHVS